MSARLPRVTGIDVVAALRRTGFVVEYIKGSHYHLVHPYSVHRQVVVPVHAGKILKPKTLKSILKNAGLTVEEFIGLL
ncbi:type II toxin-antitoxin system HicA family toxin [Desulfofundulus thermocisternus]|jgi:predicted RNA binding protein YcfA (HicA-like mRNA interferase family)|uniref:type II toxin-antitoxin system HicA family toxin n=1 Tax=Desulfofundulus thermocisternus TaxID=42471 RepID=UPI00217CDE36|nr:type II toxin-antitoxin system HicA family toxin [Desulfofundulus thermocisternus]MCS5696653.1 type II toxin-antitoxin system HicA family toxin [Desulfofundulus thermocisternus]